MHDGLPSNAKFFFGQKDNHISKLFHPGQRDNLHTELFHPMLDSFPERVVL
jgi:hypothetical protein